MRIIKCDICEKTINSDIESIRLEVRGPNYNHFDICDKCSVPITKILKDKKLLKGKETK